jgi:hypothetical protein
VNHGNHAEKHNPKTHFYILVAHNRVWSIETILSWNQDCLQSILKGDSKNILCICMRSYMNMWALVWNTLQLTATTTREGKPGIATITVWQHT